jgi:uncharacterized membrane protein
MIALVATEENARKDEAAFRINYPIVWWATLVGPFILSAALLLAVWGFTSLSAMWRLLLTGVAFFFLGKAVILGGTVSQGLDSRSFFTTEHLVVLSLYLDSMTACVLAFHLGFLFRLPVVGTKLKALVEDGQFILQSNPWMKRATFLGLVGFVLLPLAATGSVGGSIFGRLLGMSRLGTFLGITLGNVLGCLIMYFGSEFITSYIGRDNPWLLIGGIAVMVSVVLVLNHRYRQLKARQ